MNENINICPHCGERKKTIYDERCNYCGYQFIDTLTKKKNLEKMRKIISIVILILGGPWFMVGLLFFVIGTFSTINEHKKIEGFTKTDAYYVGTYDCYTDSDSGTFCEGIYVYKVDGIEYYASPAEESNSFPEKRDVYYNPNNPSESVILTNWLTLVIIGGILTFGFITVFLIQFFYFKKQIKNIDKKVIT